MSDTFKYLDKTGDNANDAAQSFLDKKVAKNKSKVKDKEGETKEPFQRKYERNPDAKALSAEEIREKFGLTYNEEHVNGAKTHANGSNNETGAIYNRETGEYLGTVQNHKEAGANFENMRSFAKESGLLQEDVNGMDSLNDVATIASQLNMGGGGGGKPAAKEPIKHSPEIEDAKKLLKDYDTSVRSGQMSKDLYGDYTNIKVDTSVGSEFESNEGINGIGTEGGVANDSSADKASAAFLQDRKSKIKEQYQFRPAS